MTEPWHPAPRDVMEAACRAALARYLQAIGDHTPRREAEAAYTDHLLKAWERTVTGQVSEQAFRNSMAVTR